MEPDAPWQAPPRPPGLDRGEVHVWRVATDPSGAILARFGSTLSHEEEERGDRFRSPADRGRFLASRAALRTILAEYAGCPAEALAFDLGPHGKPSLRDHPAIAFNLSHSGDLALVAVATGARVGVDVEAVRAIAERDSIAARFFSPRERVELAGLPGPLQTAGFFRLWTCKEAYIKAIGAGLSEPLDGFSVAADPREPPRLVEIGGDPARAEGWTIRSIDAGEGYAAALAIEGTRWELRRIDVAGLTRT